MSTTLTWDVPQEGSLRRRSYVDCPSFFLFPKEGETRGSQTRGFPPVSVEDFG